jgi:hypothetical protein
MWHVLRGNRVGGIERGGEFLRSKSLTAKRKCSKNKQQAKENESSHKMRIPDK